jgi:hypothetical protein
MLGVAEIDQRIEVFRCLEHDIPAAPAIAAIGPAELDEFFTAERDNPVASVAGADVDLGLIEEFHNRKKESSFSEEKEAKRLLFLTQAARSRPWPRTLAQRRNKSLLLLFFRKEVLSFLLRRHRQRFDRNVNPIIRPRLKFYVAFDHGKDRMILAKPNILPRLPARAALADNDVAGHHHLTAVFLHAEAPSFRIAPVA